MPGRGTVLLDGGGSSPPRPTPPDRAERSDPTLSRSRRVRGPSVGHQLLSSGLAAGGALLVDRGQPDSWPSLRVALCGGLCLGIPAAMVVVSNCHGLSGPVLIGSSWGRLPTRDV